MPSTKRIFSAFRTGSGEGAIRTMRWMRSIRTADEKVNWVLDPDINGFFDRLDHK